MFLGVKLTHEIYNSNNVLQVVVKYGGNNGRPKCCVSFERNQLQTTNGTQLCTTTTRIASGSYTHFLGKSRNEMGGGECVCVCVRVCVCSVV